MPQNKNEIPAVGIWSALRADVLAVAKKFPKEARALIQSAGTYQTTTQGKHGVTVKATPPKRLLEMLLESLAYIAVEPLHEVTRATVHPSFLNQCANIAPKLTVAVLGKCQSVWFKGSEQSRIWRWLARSTGFLRGTKRVSVWDCTDDELAQHFAHDHPATASVNDPKLTGRIVKARNKLAADIRRGQRMSSRR